MAVDTAEIRNCKICTNSFQPKRRNSTCCGRLLTWKCEICNEDFERICKDSKPRACSKSCTSKLIRRDQGLRNLVSCVICNDDFPAVVHGAMYCNKTISVTCKGCPNTFERLCNAGLGSYCSTSCRFKYMRKELYEIKEHRECGICGEYFQPKSSKQLFCKTHDVDCLFCGATFSINSQSAKEDARGKYCDNACSTLAQTNSRISRNLVEEYKSPNEWARQFKESNGRKPSQSDFRAYFNIDSFPRLSVDFSLFRKTRDSYFEKSVENFIKEIFPDHTVRRNVRNIYLEDSKIPKEIDLFIEDLKLGFEIQDFATHSKDSETELSEFKSVSVGKHIFKRGPINHEAKRRAAKEQLGVVLIDIWEDEIKDGRYKNIVANAIAAAQKSILVK